MGIVTGNTVSLEHRFMGYSSGNRLQHLCMTGKTELGLLHLQHLAIPRSMRIMTGGTFFLRHGPMHNFFHKWCLIMTVKTDLHSRHRQGTSAAAPTVTLAACPFFEGLMYYRQEKPLIRSAMGVMTSGTR